MAPTATPSDLRSERSAATRASSILQSGQAAVTVADPQLEALFREEVRLHRICEEQQKQIAEVQARLQAAMEPDPQLADYMKSLKESVLQEDKRREAAEIAAEANLHLQRATEALQHHEASHRVSVERLQATNVQFSQLAQDTAFMRREIFAAEQRLAQAKQHYGQQREAHSQAAVDARQQARSMEARRSYLEVEVSKLEAEVRWYRLRCGEELAGD